LQRSSTEPRVPGAPGDVADALTGARYRNPPDGAGRESAR
jgi:hypothetical protein